MPLVHHFTLKNCQIFDEFPIWKNLMFLPVEVRKQAFADPETRKKLRADLNDPRPTNFHKRWDILKVDKDVHGRKTQKYVGKSWPSSQRCAIKTPLDAFLDLALEENLETIFWNANNGGDLDAMGEILRSPYVLVGTSDAGAHVLFGADFGYGTILLGLWVRERQVHVARAGRPQIDFSRRLRFSDWKAAACCAPATPQTSRSSTRRRSTPRSRSGRMIFRPTPNEWSSAPSACTTRSSTER